MSWSDISISDLIGTANDEVIASGVVSVDLESFGGEHEATSHLEVPSDEVFDDGMDDVLAKSLDSVVENNAINELLTTVQLRQDRQISINIISDVMVRPPTQTSELARLLMVPGSSSTKPPQPSCSYVGQTKRKRTPTVQPQPKPQPTVDLQRPLSPVIVRKRVTKRKTPRDASPQSPVISLSGGSQPEWVGGFAEEYRAPINAAFKIRKALLKKLDEEVLKGADEERRVKKMEREFEELERELGEARKRLKVNKDRIEKCRRDVHMFNNFSVDK